ncbi:MAG: ROK family protein [Clostridiales bacterium]|nr:ROK family protein [Clostridiales bacterium]MCK9349931.1 ROK family protein [Clostridiales bacterium]MDY0119313.1 ROK family protein [Clostridia bacterium]NLG30052.1 ROK family protein [Clostridiaceae bacterium]
MGGSIGIDLGGTNIAVGLVSDACDIVSRKDVKTMAPRSARSITKTIVSLIRSLLNENKLTSKDLSSIGIGLPGIVDTKSGELLFATNLKLSHVNFPELFHEYFPNLNVYVGNDADCAVLGEYLAGEAKNYASALLLTLGTGVGGGLVVDGKIFRGGDGLGIEPGHIVVETDRAVKCACGQWGCLETYASIQGLIRLTEEVLASEGDSVFLQSPYPLNAIRIFEAVRAKDPIAEKIHARYIGYLAAGIKTLVALYRPHIILLGGGLSNASDLLIEPLEKAVRRDIFSGDILPVPSIRVASLRNDAGIIGAAKLYRESSL